LPESPDPPPMRHESSTRHRLVWWLVFLATLVLGSLALAQPRAEPEAPPVSEEADAPEAPESGPVPTAPFGDEALSPDDPVAPPERTVRLPPGEAEQARDLPIVSIEVTGNRRVTKEDVLAYLREREGQPFAPETLATDVRELWNSGFFDDIEVDLERTDAGVRLRFIVRERPNIAKVEFEGNDEIDDDDLGGAIEVKPNTILSHPAINRSIQKIRDLYAEQGYFLAEVKSEVFPLKNNEVRVKFTITEHNQVSVRRITFIGNEAFTQDQLRALMFTGATSFFSFGSGGPFRQDAFERDIAVLSAHYYDHGYLMVSIHTPRVMLTPDRNGIEISITIAEGPRFRVRQLRVYERGPEGQEVEPIGGRRKLRNMVRTKSGDYFNRAALLEDLQSIRTLYRDHSFANVEANPDTKLDPDRREVDVIVPIVRGPPVTFERIEVNGNTKTRDKVIRREMEVAEGDPFHETNLERSRRRITALGYFERVDISTEQGSAPDRMNVHVEVTERPTGTFQVGAGFSSIENFIATAQVQQANLFGNGQSLSLNAQISGIRTLINIQYFEPYFLDSDFRFSVNLYDQLRVFQDFSQSTIGGAITLGYPLIQPELAASMTYTLEHNDVSTQTRTMLLGTASAISVFNRLPLANLFNDGLTSSLRPAITYDTRDNRLFPTSGVFLRASTELAAASFGSETEFWRNTFTGRFFYPLGLGIIAKMNTEAGLVTAPGDEGVPIFARYFLGGILDVRGFRFRTVGPRARLTSATDPNSPPIPNGANIGGNLQYYQNVELEFPIIDSVGIRGVVFTDAGNAWNLEGVYCQTYGQSALYDAVNPCFDFPQDLLQLRTSWGFGIRWFSPLGPLRFEWGFPFAPLPYEETNRFEFTIGNFF
jgi:outer membrane protein insertion porin family